MGSARPVRLGGPNDIHSSEADHVYRWNVCLNLCGEVSRPILLLANAITDCTYHVVRLVSCNL